MKLVSLRTAEGRPGQRTGAEGTRRWRGGHRFAARGRTHDLAVLLIKDGRGPAGNYPLISELPSPLDITYSRGCRVCIYMPMRARVCVRVRVCVCVCVCV